MSVSLRRNTLAFQFGTRPGVLYRDMTSTLVPDVVTQMNSFFECSNMFGWIEPDPEAGVVELVETPMGNPEVDAIIFYMMNHAATMIRQKYHPIEPLGAKLALLEEYHRQLAYRSARMFFYMLLICTRESRHEKKGYDTNTWKMFEDKYGEALLSFHQSIKGKSSTDAALALRKAPPKMTLGDYTCFLSEVFYHGVYHGGYGGKAWGKVADVLRDYVHGKITAEMMMDTAFTLCHNNGPIFNKGMLFEGYSNEIYKILDVQRSGQIPQLVAGIETPKSAAKTVQTLFKICAKHVGDEFSSPGYVDWYKVESLGSMHKYPEQKKAQAVKWGLPEGHAHPPTKLKPQEELSGSDYAMKKLKAGVPVKELSTQIMVMPDLYVTLCEERP